MPGSDDLMTTSMERSAFLKLTATVGGATALLGSGAGTAAAARLAQQKTKSVAIKKATQLRLLTWDGYLDKAWVAPFEKKWGVTIKATYLNSDDEDVAKMAAGGDKIYDIISVASPASTTMIGLGVVKALDLSRLPHYSGTLNFTRTAFVKNGEVYGAPFDWDVNPCLYYSSGVSKPLTSWNDFWTDPKLQGKFALNDESGGLYIGAAVLGLDRPASRIGHFTDADLRRIKDKMVQLKPRALWTQGGELTSLLANHEVVASMAGWSQVYNTLRRTKPAATKGLKEVVFPHHGATAFTEAYMISKSIKPENEDAAYAWLDYHMTPQLGAKFGASVGYAPAAKNAKQYMDQRTLKATHMNAPDKWVHGAIVKPDPGPRRQAYVETWQEIRSALK
jgi:putative spermidine/putrescine transport system substrate-binding protein